MEYDWDETRRTFLSLYQRLVPMLPRRCFLMVILLAAGWTSGVQGQTPNNKKAGDDLKDRVEKLETRIAHLERLLFSTAQLTVYDAERRLNDAREQLQQSRRLYLKGMLHQSQVDFDRFVVRRAEHELRLSQARDGQYQIAVEIDLIQAEYNLDVAKKQLEFSRGMLAKGYVTPEQILREETAIDRAQKAFDTATQKLATLKNAALPGVEPKKN